MGAAMEKERRAGERSIRRGSEDEQGSGREQPAGKWRNEKGRGQGSSQRGRELTLDGPWLARRSSVRRRPSGFQAPRESRTSSGYDRRARPAGASSGDDLHRWGRAAASPDRRGRAAGRSLTGRPSKWQAGQGNPWRAEQMRARPRAGREIFERSPARRFFRASLGASARFRAASSPPDA